MSVSVSSVGPAKLGILRATCDELVDGETYSATRAKNGNVRVVAVNQYGEARYPMMNNANQSVWRQLVNALS